MSDLQDLPAPTTPQEFTERARQILDTIADAVPMKRTFTNPQLDQAVDWIKALAEAMPQIGQSFQLTREWVDQASGVIEALYQYQGDIIRNPPDRDSMSGKEFHKSFNHLACEVPARITAAIRKLENESLLLKPRQAGEFARPVPADESQAESASDEQFRAPNDNSQSDSGVCTWNDLTDRQRNCMLALYSRKACDAEKRMTTAQIAREAEGDQVNPDNFKKALSGLVKAGLCHSQGGRDGGYYLSEHGYAMADSHS